MNADLLISLARESIRNVFTGQSVDKSDYLPREPKLDEPGATFVTLSIDGRLRGCIGSLVAHRPLFDDIVANARSAAFRDPRFTPLSADELDAIGIEVSVLTPPAAVEYTTVEELKRIIRPGIDGVILRLGNHQATFLPQVWEELPSFDLFFAHLGTKAGIGSDPLAHYPQIYLYQVDKYTEHGGGCRI